MDMLRDIIGVKDSKYATGSKYLLELNPATFTYGNFAKIKFHGVLKF